MFDFFTQRKDPSRTAIFFVPTPDPFENPLVETNPSALRQWATALPFANPDQLANAVLTSLVRLNRFPATVRKRGELMEIYDTPVQRLVHGSVARKGQVPLHALRQVMLEMAYGYSHLANDCLNGKANKKVLDRLTRVIYRTISFYLQEYLYACEEFDCRASHTYREISRLHTFAEEQKIHLTPLVDADLPDTERTIEQQYCRFLLLRLLDPCHLQEGEPRICYEYLDDLAAHARFMPPSHRLERTGHYVIDRLGEVPPSLFEPDAVDTLAQPRFNLFDLHPVSLLIHQQLRALERSEEQKPPAMSGLTTREITNLLARMLKTWHIRLQRDSERHNTSGEVKLWLGLNNIHRYLSQDDNGQAEHKDQEEDEITLTQVQSGLRAHAQDPNRPQLIALRCNQSRSGVALILSPGPGIPSLVGELVLISLQSGASVDEWKIGIIKRALKAADNSIEIGIQFVQGRVVPITLQSTSMNPDSEQQESEEEETPIRPGLYIDQGHSHRSSLIVPKHFFALGQEYRVEEMIPAPVITPLQILESTAHFERYRVKPV
jgi:hypothetical protein